jgi:hypothetical protein
VGQCDAYKVNFCVICDLTFSSALLLTSEITAACDEFPATCRGGVRRVTVAPQHRKESSADVVRRCTQNTLMLPCGSKTVDHAFDIDGHALPTSSHRRSRSPVPIRVFCVHRLAASALKLLLCGAAGRCWRTHCQARVAAHASDAHLGTARVWRPVLVVANGCAAYSVLNTCLLADVLGRCEIWTGVRRSVLLRRGCRLGHSTRIVSEGWCRSELLSNVACVDRLPRRAG